MDIGVSELADYSGPGGVNLLESRCKIIGQIKWVTTSFASISDGALVRKPTIQAPTDNREAPAGASQKEDPYNPYPMAHVPHYYHLV